MNGPRGERETSVSEVHIDDLAERLGTDDVIAALADSEAVSPPPELRGRVLASIARRALVDPVSAPELYRRRVTAMSALLDELFDEDWTMRAEPYEWTVQGLVAHLAVIEEHTRRQLGLSDQAPLSIEDSAATPHLDVGADLVEELAAGRPEETVRRWRSAAWANAEYVDGDSFDPSMSVPLHAWPFDAATALVARAFEIWTHADDIRRATGRPLDVPSTSELRAMSSASVSGLPTLLAVTGGPPLRPTRVVLTGAGGGTFDLGRADGAPAELLLVADVVEYCRLASRRVQPAELAGHREGDDTLLDALLHAAAAVAV